MIRDCVAASKRKVALNCVPGSAPGLLHLKLFYIVWRTEAKRTARTLIFGSANADDTRRDCCRISSRRMRRSATPRL
jgi:hypothetical protein